MEKYTGNDDLCEHLDNWKKAWGEEPQLEWVHIFCHTLDTIPMNWYVEKELRHGNVEWDALKDIFLLTFHFEEGFECINEALQEIKTFIFKIHEESIEWLQPNWGT